MSKMCRKQSEVQVGYSSDNKDMPYSVRHVLRDSMRHYLSEVESRFKTYESAMSFAVAQGLKVVNQVPCSRIGGKR